MGLITTEKAELDAYQHKHVAQTWYNQWKDSRALGCGSMSSEIFKRAFLFIAREKMKDKVEEFINLCKGVISHKKYFFKFIMMSKYAFSLVLMIGMK